MYLDLSAHKQNKVCVCMYTCVYVIIHFNIVCNIKRLEQSKCSLMQAGFIKLWYIHTMEFQAATKKK